ncbi:MAG: metal-dependent transcriptional regulator [Thermodesulfobacteriota bacterium]
MNLDERAEEALEALWESLEESARPVPADGIAELERAGLVEAAGTTLRFTDAGRRAARQAIRRHRLAERLFHDVVETTREDMEAAACQMEHALRRGVEEKVCELLGHPATCPHGKPIPPGSCCAAVRAEGERHVCPVSHLRAGEEGVVAYLKTHDAKQVQKLMAMGVLPGSAIRIDRTFPSFVFTVGYSQFAVDAGMADLIQVRRRDPGPSRGPIGKGAPAEISP